MRIDKTTGTIEFGSISISPETMAKDVKSRYCDFILRTDGVMPDEKIVLQNDEYWVRLNFNADKLTRIDFTPLCDGKPTDDYDDLYELLIFLSQDYGEQFGAPFWETDTFSGGELEEPPIGGLSLVHPSHGFLQKTFRQQYKRFYELHPCFSLLQKCLLWLPLLVLILAYLWPVNNGITRCLIVLGAWGVFIEILSGAYWLWQKKSKWSFVLIPVLIVLLAWMFVPALHYTPLFAKLQDSYVAELRSYDGTRYLWGGENRFGIDCSGLPRKALRNALLKTGLKEMNRDFLFLALKNWWFDTSAKALAQGYRDYCFPLNLAGTVASAPEKALKPGDLAITDDGVHVMVYLAPDEWISADPGQGKVVIEHPSKSKNPWFVRPVHFFRFTLLENAEIRSGARAESMKTAWQNFLKGSQSRCCLSTRNIYAKNLHWNVFVSYGRDYTLSFLAERLDSKAATGHFFCGLPEMNEGEVALVCLERVSGRSILKYSGRSPALKKIIADADGLAAPYFYVVDRIQKNPEALDAVRNYLLESEKSEVKK